MKPTRSLWPLVLCLFASSLFCGCTKRDGQGPSDAIKTNRDAAFRLFADTNTSGDGFNRVLRQITNSLASEEPNQWTKIANNELNPSESRCEAILALLSQRIRTNASVNQLLGFSGITNWFTNNVVSKVTVANVLPVDRAKAVCVYALRPDCCHWTNGTVVLSLSDYVDENTMRSLLNGSPVSNDVCIVDIAVHRPQVQQDYRKLQLNK